VLTFRVPRWHLVTPVKAEKVRWSVYGWALEPKKDFLEAGAEWLIKKAIENPALAGIIFVLIVLAGIFAFWKWGAQQDSPKKD